MATSTVTLDDAVVEEIASKALAEPASNVATFEELFAKRRRVLTFPIHLTDADGQDIERTMKFQALSAPEYDALVATCPPDSRGKAAGAAYNPDTFAPALISAVSLEPHLSVEQATRLYQSKDWSGGEMTSLFYYAQRVCNSGLDVPFNERG